VPGSGMMCAIQAAATRSLVYLIDHSAKLARKNSYLGRWALQLHQPEYQAGKFYSTTAFVAVRLWRATRRSTLLAG